MIVQLHWFYWLNGFHLFEAILVILMRVLGIEVTMAIDLQLNQSDVFFSQQRPL